MIRKLQGASIQVAYQPFPLFQGPPKKGIHTNKKLLNSAISEMSQLQKLQL